jgi:hypothetical protein
MIRLMTGPAAAICGHPARSIPADRHLLAD